MDREKRHSKEAEEELDKKIALIREKNQIIVERTKEIEADRAQSTDEQPKKSPKASSEKSATPPKVSPISGGRGKKEQWDREWDKGKTPVEKWRENVPSMDVAGRLAGRGGGRGGGQQQKARQPEQKGSRLEGRISGVSLEGGAVRGGGASAGANRGRSGNRGGRGGQQRNQHSRSVEKVGGDLKISIANIESGDYKKAPRQRNQPPRQKKDNQGSQGSATGEQDKTNEKKRASRPRRENDKYVVKTIMGRMVNRVVQMEKRAKNKAEKEQELPQEVENTAPEEPRIVESEQEHKEVVQAEKQEEQIPEAPKDPKPSVLVKDTVTELSASPDANQNIIVLEKEKVATIQMSTA